MKRIIEQSLKKLSSFNYLLLFYWSSIIFTRQLILKISTQSFNNLVYMLINNVLIVIKFCDARNLIVNNSSIHFFDLILEFFNSFKNFDHTRINMNCCVSKCFILIIDTIIHFWYFFFKNIDIFRLFVESGSPDGNPDSTGLGSR
jgi:hypothetical protein